MSAENLILGAGDADVTGPTRVTRVPGTAVNADSGATTCRVRIHRDGLLVARCSATGLAPGRLFVSIDPLHYPVNSQLDLEFVHDGLSRGKNGRHAATVMARNVDGIELALKPAAA